jgi:hypothetical protein
MDEQENVWWLLGLLVTFGSVITAVIWFVVTHV